MHQILCCLSFKQSVNQTMTVKGRWEGKGLLEKYNQEIEEEDWIPDFVGWCQKLNWSRISTEYGLNKARILKEHWKKFFSVNPNLIIGL